MCIVKILQPVYGITDPAGNLLSVVVTGTSTCDLVTVRFDCGGEHYSEGIAEVHSGVWSITLTNARLSCTCKDEIRIYASCEDGACEDKFVGLLSCRPESDCPIVVAAPDPIDADLPCVGGKRLVQGKIIKTASSAGLVIGLSIDIDGQPAGNHAPSASSFTIPYSTYLAPGTHLLMWTFSDPQCVGGGLQIPVPACEGCPGFEFSTVEGECRDGLRSVTVTATLSPGSGPIAATMLHGSKKIGDLVPGATSFSGTDGFPGGPNAVTVTTTVPECPSVSHNFQVSTCPGSVGPGQNGGPVDRDDDSDDGSWGCILGRIGVVLLFATAIFLTLLAMCLPPPVTAVVVAAAGAWIVASLALALWAALCGSRCGTYLVTWQSLMIGAWLAAYMMTCCVLAFAATIVLAVASLGMFVLWTTRCRLTPCRVLVELLWVTAVPAATLLAVLKYLMPCGLLSDVLTVNSVVVAALAVAAPAACKK